MSHASFSLNEEIVEPGAGHTFWFTGNICQGIVVLFNSIGGRCFNRFFVDRFM